MKSEASSELRAWGARPDGRQGRRALVMVVLRRAGRGSRHEICHRALHERILPLPNILRYRNFSSQSESGHCVRCVFKFEFAMACAAVACEFGFAHSFGRVAI